MIVVDQIGGWKGIYGPISFWRSVLPICDRYLLRLERQLQSFLMPFCDTCLGVQLRDILQRDANAGTFHFLVLAIWGLKLPGTISPFFRTGAA